MELSDHEKHVNDPLENRMFGVAMTELKNDDCVNKQMRRKKLWRIQMRNS